MMAASSSALARSSAVSAASRAVAWSVSVATEPLLAVADHQEGDRHEGDDGEEEQRDDQRDAALGPRSGGVAQDGSAPER